jgi:hypothetical protein
MRSYCSRDCSTSASCWVVTWTERCVQYYTLSSPRMPARPPLCPWHAHLPAMPCGLGMLAACRCFCCCCCCPALCCAVLPTVAAAAAASGSEHTGGGACATGNAAQHADSQGSAPACHCCTTPTVRHVAWSWLQPCMLYVRTLFSPTAYSKCKCSCIQAPCGHVCWPCLLLYFLFFLVSFIGKLNGSAHSLTAVAT